MISRVGLKFTISHHRENALILLLPEFGQHIACVFYRPVVFRVRDTVVKVDKARGNPRDLGEFDKATDAVKLHLVEVFLKVIRAEVPRFVVNDQEVSLGEEP